VQNQSKKKKRKPIPSQYHPLATKESEKQFETTAEQRTNKQKKYRKNMKCSSNSPDKM